MPLIGMSCWEREYDTNIAHGERHHMLSATYTTALVAAGATPVLLPSVTPDHAAAVVDRMDGIIISGGGDIDPSRYGAVNESSSEIDPIRDEWELALVDATRTAGKPLLGICRGAQLLNVAFGGTLEQHVWDSEDHPDLWNDERTFLRPGTHDVTLTGTLRDVYGRDRRRVNSYHHQSVDRVGDDLVVLAMSDDGRPEGLASTGTWPALAVQWHPERLDLSDEQPLFGWLVDACG